MLHFLHTVHEQCNVHALHGVSAAQVFLFSYPDSVVQQCQTKHSWHQCQHRTYCKAHILIGQAVFCTQGLSSELGAFVAGVMLSSTDQQEHCLSQLTSIRHFFMSLFISTTGLVMSPRFLLQHLPVLAGGVLVCIICKTCLVSCCWAVCGVSSAASRPTVM